MSTMHLSRTHIAAIVGTAIGTDRSGWACRTRSEEYGVIAVLFSILAEANAQAWSERYGEQCEAVELNRSEVSYFTVNPLTPAEMFSALDCLKYNTHSAYANDASGIVSKAYTVMERMRSANIRRVDGYSEAPWGIEHGYRGADKSDIMRII